MNLTVSIKDQNKIDAFLELIKEIDYIEFIDVKDEGNLLPEHRILLDARLNKIENGESTFKSWNQIKQKYENRIV